MRRPPIGSRATALIAALVIFILSSLVADRLGAPAAVTAAALFSLVVVASASAGLMTRTVRLTTFRLAGFRLGWTRGGGALLVLLCGIVVLSGLGFAAATAPVAAGVLGAALFYAPALRRSAAPGLGGFVAARYGSVALAGLTGVVACGAGILLAALAAPGATAGFARVIHAPPVAGQIAFVALATAALVPGGAASLAASAVIAAFVTLAAYFGPAALVLARDGNAVALVTAAFSQSAANAAISSDGAALAALAAALVAWTGNGSVMRSVALGRRVSAGVVLAGLLLTIAGLLGATASAQQPLPNGLITLGGLAPALVLTMVAAFAIRFGIAGLIDDVIYRPAGFSGTASGRLALHRVASVAAVVAVSGVMQLPLPPEAVMRAAGLVIGLWPAAVLLPSVFGRVDWRTPALGVIFLLALAAAVGSGNWPFALWTGVAAIAAVMIVAGLLLPAGNGEDRRAAVLRGDAAGPLVLENDS